MTQIEKPFSMARFGVMKHLKILEEVGLVKSRKVGRERLHYLNPVPIRELYDLWDWEAGTPLVNREPLRAAVA